MLQLALEYKTMVEITNCNVCTHRTIMVPCRHENSWTYSHQEPVDTLKIKYCTHWNSHYTMHDVSSCCALCSLLFFICACFSGSLIPKAWHLYVNKITIFRWGAFWKKKKDHSVRSQQTMNVFVYTRMCCFVFMISKHLYLITKHIFIDLEWFTEIQPEFIPWNSLELHESTGIWVKPVMIKVTGVLTCLSGIGTGLFY